MNSCVICGEICSRDVSMICPIGGNCSSCGLFLEEEDSFTNKTFVRVGKSGFVIKEKINYER